MEAEYNRRMHVQEPVITVGSQVLLKLKKHRKSTSAWDVEKPFTVTAVNGSMVTATREGKVITRNSSCFKLYRQAELDLPERAAEKSAVAPSQTESERREEAPLDERERFPPGQPTVEQATTNVYSLPDNGRQGAQGVAEQASSSGGSGNGLQSAQQAAATTSTAPGSGLQSAQQVASPPRESNPSQQLDAHGQATYAGKRGRPPKAESERLQKERLESLAAREAKLRAADVRRSDRVKK